VQRKAKGKYKYYIVANESGNYEEKIDVTLFNDKTSILKRTLKPITAQLRNRP
jgi:hypothetical protein